MLLALPNTFTKERWGAKLMELAGEAEEVCGSIGGHQLILETLDGKHLTEYF